MTTAPQKVMVISGTRTGIGRYLAEYYLERDWRVFGCSRAEADWTHPAYTHSCLDVADEAAVRALFMKIRKEVGRCDAVVNNAGIASMNHCLLTPLSTVDRILSTNVTGTFLFCREGAKAMRPQKTGRIINFATVATPLRLSGESVYAASKAAVESLTRTLAHELGEMGITVNAVGPTPIKTDLTRSVPESKLRELINRQAIKRWGEFCDVSQVIDFFLDEGSGFVTGQVIYLGGVS